MIPGYLHSSIDVAEAHTEEKPGSIHFWPPLLLYVSNHVHVGSIWQISSTARYIWRTMKAFCGLKNMVVAIFKSKKVYLGQQEGYLGRESVHIFCFE